VTPRASPDPRGEHVQQAGHESVSAKAAINPPAIPMAANVMPWRRTRATISPRVAPKVRGCQAHVCAGSPHKT